MNKNLFFLIFLTLVLQPHTEIKAAEPASQTSAAEDIFPKGVPVVIRDPFEIPPLLKQAIESRELAKKGQTAPGPAGVPTPPIQPPPMSLQGVIWGTGRARAIIDRHLVSVGDTIGEVTIQEINKDSVKILFQGKEFRLGLPQKTPQGNKI